MLDVRMPNVRMVLVAGPRSDLYAEEVRQSCMSAMTLPHNAQYMHDVIHTLYQDMVLPYKGADHQHRCQLSGSFQVYT